MPRGDRFDTFDPTRHMQRRERDQPFQVGDQRGRDDLRGHMKRAAVDDSMSHGVGARQLKALELAEERIDGDLRARELAIRSASERPLASWMLSLPPLEPIRSAAPSATSDSAPPDIEYSVNLHDDEPTLMQSMVWWRAGTPGWFLVQLPDSACLKTRAISSCASA